MFDFFKKKGYKCPYCNSLIEKELKGKFKCPSCKEEIYLERKEGKIIKLITKSDYEALQLRKKEQSAKNKYFRFFDSLEIPKGYLEKRRTEWIRKTNLTLNYDDLIWSISNEILLEYAKQKKFQEMSDLYLSMAHLQKECNKEFFYLLQEARKMELYGIKKELKGFKYKVVIVATYNRYCKDCQEQDGKMFTMEEALKKMPIPVKNCTNEGFCMCCYAAEIVD
jgi:rubrerythrin